MTPLRAFRRLASLVCVALAVLTAGAIAQESNPSTSLPFNASSRRPADDAALERALDEPMDIDVEGMTLQRLVDRLANSKIQVELDTKSIDEVGIDGGTPLRQLSVKRISVRSALDLLLTPIDLTSFVSNGRLLITTTETESNELLTKVYRVQDLTGESSGDSLIDLVTTTIKPVSWDEVGGPGHIDWFQGTFVVSQTEEVQRQIQHLLAALRRARDAEANGLPPEPILATSAAQLAANQRFEQANMAVADFNFEEQTLVSVVDEFAKAFNLPIVLDVRNLDEVGIGADTPVTRRLSRVSPRDALDMTLKALDLTFILKNEIVLITTTEVAANELADIVYPAGDLMGSPRGGGSGPFAPALIDILTSIAKPTTWVAAGGPGSIVESRAASGLVVSQTREVHEEIQGVLTALRQMRVPPTGERAAPQAEEESVSRVYRIEGDLEPQFVVNSIRELDRHYWSRRGHSLRFVQRALLVRATPAMQKRVSEVIENIVPANAPSKGNPSMGGKGGGAGGGMGGKAGAGGGMGGGMF